MRAHPALALALACLAAPIAAVPAPALAYGTLVSDGACVQVTDHRAVIDVADGVVTTVVDLVLAGGPGGANGADGADGPDGPDGADRAGITWLLAGGGDVPEVVADGAPVHVDALDSAAAVEALLALAAETGDPGPLALAGGPVWRARVGTPAGLHVRDRRPLAQERDVARLVHPVRGCAGGALHVEVRFADPVAVVLSPYHAPALERLPDGGTVARFDAWGAQPFDLEVYATDGRPDGGPVAAGLVSFRDPSCDGEAPGFFALAAAARPGAAAQRPARAKDVVLVMDSSGSMGGEKIEQARAALHHVLTGLAPADRFEVVDFDSEVRPLFGGLREATPGAIEDARAFVRRLEAGGGTFIEGGLSRGLAALDGRADAGGRPALVVFATDGQPTDGVTDRQALIELATAANRAEARLFPFGLGYDVNAFLLDGLAAANHGLSSFIRPGADIEAAIAGFYDQIRTPVMTGLELRAAGMAAGALAPAELPDLFEAAPLLVTGLYDAADVGGIVLFGDPDGGGRLSPTPSAGGLVTAGTAHGFVPRLWATRRLAQLIDRDRKAPGDAATVAAIEALAQRYGLVTPWTQFVVDEAGGVTNSYSRPDGGESGRDAVEHSSENNDMRGSQNAGHYAGGEAAMALVRHRDERTFVARDGRWWDTSLPDDAPLWDVTFGSAAYAALLRSDPALGRWLSVGPEVAFRVGCGGVRTSLPDREDLPAPSETPPAALGPASPATQWMAEPPVAAAADAPALGADDGPADPSPGGAPAGLEGPGDAGLGGDVPGDEGPRDVGCACAAAGGNVGPGWAWPLGAAALLAAVRRRRRGRGRATLATLWTGTGSPACTPSTARSSTGGRARS